MEIPEKLAKNTIELSIKRVTFTSGTNRHFRANIHSFPFVCLSHEDHTKTLL